MGWIARAQLASAVSEAGGLGIIETSSGELDAVREEIRKMRDLTDKPFGVNIAQAFVRDPAHRRVRDRPGGQLRHDQRRRPNQVHAQLKDAGLTVFHVVPTLAAALRQSTPVSTGWSWRAVRAAASRTRATSRRWCCCRSSAPGSASP